MKENEPGMAYNTKKLNKLFAVLSVVFLVCVVWIALDDYIRPWKAWQIKAIDVKKQFLKSKIKSLDEKIDNSAVKALEQDIAAAKENIKSQEDTLDKLNDELAEVEKKIYVQNMYNGGLSAKAGELQFQYEYAFSHGKKRKASKLKPELDEVKAKFAQGKDDLKALEANKTSIQNQIKAITEDRDNKEKELAKLIGDKERTVASLEREEIDPVWFLRNAPFIDFMDPTLRVEQHVVEVLEDDRYFQKVPRVDRCTTCHVFIDKAGYENQEQPFKTHPKLNELAVGLNSPHPMKVFGCTSCHQGEGHRFIDFNAPIHTPQNKAQAKKWKEKYHWHEPHKIPEPMFPLQYTEAACLKCHKGVAEVPMAEKLNEGRHLIETYGCYSCHKIEGWEYMPKPAPSLKKISGKVSKEFIKNWIWSPHSFNPKSKMPAFFNQSNNSTPEFMTKNIAEVNAMAEYLWQNSQEYKPFKKYQKGNAENGKELIATVGCIACHQVEGIEKSFTVGSQKGSYLTGTGSKVDPDWLASWLKKPSHYQNDTIMPSFRLSDKEVNDIATYLLNLKNDKFSEIEFEKLNTEIRDELLIEYFATFEPVSAAKEKLAKLSDEERTLELGRRSIGKYGCYSCHTIEGFKPDRAPIGPELTKVGSKPLTQFGFGQQHGKVDHTREAWFSAHLKNPKIWDEGVPKAFKDLNRMPNFYLKDSEIEKMVTYLLGLVSVEVPLKGQRRLSANEKFAEIGKRITAKYNCAGCHKIDGLGGDITKAYEDGNEGPPWLVKEGHRVEAEWLNYFLVNVGPIRPWLKVRMPSFHYQEGEVNKIVDYFRADADQPIFEKEEEVVWEPGEKAAAKKLWNELACVSCHTGGFTNEAAQGPNLYYAAKRLRTTWIEAWLTNPTGILEYTPMPNFWDGGTIPAVEGVLGDDPKKQIKAMVKFVRELNNGKYQAPYRQE